MSSSDAGELESGPLVCGYCGRALDLLPGGQELGHEDGTELCPEAFEEVRILPTPERMSHLEARHLLAIEPHDERESRPIGVGATLLIFGLLGALCWGGVWAVLQLLGDVL